MTHVNHADNGDVEIDWKQRKLVLAGDGITFYARGQKIADFPYNAIEAVFDIASGSDVYASDFEFTALALPQQVLVIPVEFGNFGTLLPAKLRIALERQPLISAYYIDAAPRRWRPWRWNPLDVPSVKLMLDDRTHLTRYQQDWLLRRGPLSLTDYTDPKLIAADAETYRKHFWQRELKGQE